MPRTLTSLVILAFLPSSFASCVAPNVAEIPPVTVAVARTPRTERDNTMTRKTDTVDVIHGTQVRDPYRWLEESESSEVKDWTAQQNALTERLLEAIPGRKALRAEAMDLLQIGHVELPEIRAAHGGMRYFHTKRQGTQSQPTLYVRDGVHGKDRPLVDMSAMSADGTTALDWWFPSRDGRLLAWGKSDSGSEESTLYVRDVDTGKDLAEHIPHTRYASLAWLPDGKSFYYARHPTPGTVPAGDEKYFQHIFHHVLGDDPAKDELVFGEGRDKTDIPEVLISPDGRWLVMRVHMGWDKSEVFIRDLSAKGASWVPVAVGQPALFDPIPRNDRLYLLTNKGAPRYKLYAVPYENPGAWKEVLPEHPKDILGEAIVLKNEIVTTYLHDAASRIERFALDGKSKGAITLPGIGSASVAGTYDGEEAFVGFTSFVTPSSVHRVDLRSGKLAAWDQVGEKFSADDIEVRQIFGTSKDGTRVPIFVVARKGLALDGKNPTILWGYGGFNVNETPAFSTRALLTVRHGGVWASAILRGGGEFGEAWHQGGMLAKKQNVFDDYYAAADKLVADRITSADHLGVCGGSNGGLLTSTAVTQEPTKFRAALSLVPLTDMVRYHRFRIAKLWIPEFGDPDNAAEFPYLYAYSPYHHVVDGTRYPAVMLTTAESDSRVDPMHARKMAARLEEAQGDKTRPILLRVETKAGHGAGKPVAKLADELSDELAFMFHELGVSSFAP